MKILSDSEIEFNYRWLKDYYDTVAKIDYYETMIDKQTTQETRAGLISEINFLKQDLEDFRNLIQNLRSTFPKVVYLKYIEGYTLDEAADEIGYSMSYVRSKHARFVSKLKERGIDISN